MTTTDRAVQTSTQTDDILFRPRRVAGMDLPNALVMAPMTRERSAAGTPDDSVADYYGRRASGGIGLIITEGILVDHPSAGAEADVPRLVGDERESGWATVVERVHASGSKVLAQLWHQGSERSSADGVPSWTPSGVREDGAPIGAAMTTRDIDLLVERYADAAAAAQRAGFDGVEIHAAHGYLLDEFLWQRTNRRSDGYGGSVHGRVRIVAEIVAAVRAATGARLPIGVRFSQFKERDFTAQVVADPHELESLLTPLSDAGADLLHASTRRLWEPAFADSSRTLAGWTRHITGLPVIAVGSVGLTRESLRRGPASLPGLANLIEGDEFDLVAAGRALLANPQLFMHAQAGRYEQIAEYRKEHESVFP